MVERNQRRFNSSRSEVSPYEDENPVLVGYRCPQGDWEIGPDPFFRAIEKFGRHNSEAHLNNPQHMEQVYELPPAPGRRRRD